MRNPEANHHLQTLQTLAGRSSSISKIAPNVEELYKIIKIAIEQDNAVGCNTINVSLRLYSPSF